MSNRTWNFRISEYKWASRDILALVTPSSKGGYGRGFCADSPEQAQACQSLHCMDTQSMDVDGDSVKTRDVRFGVY